MIGPVNSQFSFLKGFLQQLIRHCNRIQPSGRAQPFQPSGLVGHDNFAVADVEHFFHLSRDGRYRRVRIWSNDDGPAQLVEFPYLFTAFLRFSSSFTGSRGQLAGDGCCHQKGEQRHPILRVMYRERSKRREKEEVEAQHPCN